jgi:hypothetical protein
MMAHDILKNTWIYQEIRQDVVEEVEQEQIAQMQVMVVEILQARFARIVPLGKRIVERIGGMEELRHLIVKIGAARGEKEAREALLEIEVGGDR